MFEQNQESGEGFFYRCPGMECPDFASAAGDTWEEKTIEACTSCNKCKGNGPINPDDAVNADCDLDSLIAEVEEIVKEQDAGFKTEIENYTIYKLLIAWREAEKQVAQIQALRMQAFLRGWMKEG